MATSLDALEALLQFREGALMKSRSPARPAMPVPNPLDPSQPHLIEGDASSPLARRQAFGSGAKSAFSSKSAYAPVENVTKVPNPLAAPMQPQPLPPPVSCVEALAPSSSQGIPVMHGFEISTDSGESSMTYGTQSQALEVDVRTDKIQDALNSKPQRGKKRQNLNDSERLELTKTRNREHAKSTRMKKKQRLEKLMDMEKKYLLLKEKETLDLRRRQVLTDFVETSGNRPGQLQSKGCPHSSSLIELASAELGKPQFSAIEPVALSTENSGMVKVSAHGTDLESGDPKTVLAVISVAFSPGTANISIASLYWSSQKNTTSSGGSFPPSISVLSFES